MRNGLSRCSRVTLFRFAREEAPVMTEPGDHGTADAGGRSRLRASRTDRERVIELLKVAFVQDRITHDELDTRVGQALASRTHADLADLTADIPAGPAAAEPAGRPARTLATAARRSGICLLVPLALVGLIALTHAEFLVGPVVLCVIAAAVAVPGFLGYGAVDAWQQRRSRRQPPARPGRDRRHPSRRGFRVPRATRPKPGAA